MIAGILNRQERATAYGHRFTAGRVGNLRRHWGIPCFEPTACAPEGELLTIKKAAVVLGVAPSTIHRLLNDGIIAGEQPTPGAPWRIRLTKDLKDRFNGDAGEDFLPMREAMRALGVSRQTVLQRVKRGELAAGVPSSTGLTKPFSITPDLRNARMSLSARLSVTRAATRAIKLS